MKVNGIAIDDTFAEAFGMSGTGVIITADSMKWARQAAVTMSGFGTSVIGAGAEVGIDRELKPEETPDGRPGVRVLAPILGFLAAVVLHGIWNGSTFWGGNGFLFAYSAIFSTPGCRL